VGKVESVGTEPWDVPLTADGRATLWRLVDEYARSGMGHELGLTLSNLAYVYKHLGTGDPNVPAWAEAGRVGRLAVDLLRKTDDREGLAKALRNAALAFLPGKDEMLEEARVICAEIGDFSGEGLALFAMAVPPRKDIDDLLDQARICFERSGNKAGLTDIKHRLGIIRCDAHMIATAAEEFASAGNLRSAERAYVAASAFGRDVLGFEEVEQFLLKALRLAEAAADTERQVSYLKSLVRELKRAGEKESAKRYRSMLKALNASVESVPVS